MGKTLLDFSLEERKCLNVSRGLWKFKVRVQLEFKLIKLENESLRVRRSLKRLP